MSNSADVTPADDPPPDRDKLTEYAGAFVVVSAVVFALLQGFGVIDLDIAYIRSMFFTGAALLTGIKVLGGR